MTAIEQTVISLLKENARYSMADIAKQLKKTEDEVASIVEGLETQGVILKYTTVINEEALKDAPTKIQVWVELNISPEKKTGYDAIANRICQYPQVIQHYLVSGEHDFLVLVEGGTHQDIAAFIYEKLASIEGVTGTNTHFILKRYKAYGTLIQENDAPDRMAVMA